MIAYHFNQRRHCKAISTGALYAALTLLLFVLLPPVECAFPPTPQTQLLGGTTTTRCRLVPKHTLALYRPLVLRGGSLDEGESESETDDVESDQGVDDNASPLLSILQFAEKVTAFVKKLTIQLTRALTAVLEGDTEQGATKFFTKCKRTVVQLFELFFPADLENEEDDKPETNLNAKERPTKDDDDSPSDDANEKDSTTESQRSDFGTYLSKTYNVEATRDEVSNKSPILGGSIQEALGMARQQGRMLVVFIPASSPHKGKKDSADKQALQSFLSAKVATLAEKPARKKDTGASFYLWSAKAKSPEAVVALKRLKVQQLNSKGQKVPILLVAYPAQVVDSRGQFQLRPKVLAQHHCSPPPSPETMATWLNALRKRHAKQYATMQLQVKETQFFQERRQGYQESLKSDKEREHREAREKVEREAKERAEKEHEEAIKRRRKEIRELLADEPAVDEKDVKTVSLRLADGRSAKRRFAANAVIADVLNWLDVTFEIERETVVLTTMNGKSSFSWEDGKKTLTEAGLGKMAGLRVLEKKHDPATKTVS